MTATPFVVDFSAVDLVDHLNFLFSGTRGYVVIGLLRRVNGEADGPPRDQFYLWPREREAAIAAVKEAEGVDVFVCPYPMQTPDRAKGNSTSRRMVHTDLDYDVPAHVRDTLRRWGFRLVASGTPGHVQAFGRLSRSLTPAEHQGVEEALRDWARQWGKAEKITDNDYMRIPGKVSCKTGAGNVEILAPGRWKIDAGRLIAWLGATPKASTSTRTRESVKTVPIPESLPGDVLALMSEPSAGKGDRSDREYAAVFTVAEAGYSRDQVHAILANYGPGVDKRGDRWPQRIDDLLDQWQDKTGKAVVKYDPGEHFWDRRATLRHIKEYAEASIANPWSTLGVVLVRMLYQVPPRVKLPGRNNSEAGTRALNMYVALVGNSGAGKKTATDAAAHAIDVGPVKPYLPIGSGEGIAKAYRRPARRDEPSSMIVVDGLAIKATAVIFDVAEVATWNALTGRTGNTLISEVLKGFSGETLGFTNADEQKTIAVPANSYRMGLIIGAQPGTCGPLLGNVTSGLPQRFLWMPSEPERDYDPDDMPPVPKPRVWPAPEFGIDDHTVLFPKMAEREAIVSSIDRNKDPMESQAIVIKMRVAVALALLEGRIDVNEEDWSLAGEVMTVNRRTREFVARQLRDQERKANRAHGARLGERQLAADQVVTAEKVDRAKTRVLTVLGKARGGWVTRLKSKVGTRYTDELPQAVEELLAEKKIERESVTYHGQDGWRYRRVQG